ncbi:DUF31 family protein [Ureaplasma miroungigenitalium]|uniref:Ig-specific serine endopeptidase MIP n=1 Tax=Ureaplasma miroungigenitalium TaxID=1042321 RepID=UPI0021E8F3BF|nr:DUF31 family protein [Ureaplasma miroungigenitalium]MCV3733983.1 DUF31 family protein [Ureaplasma miroungigenitalium]
MLKSKKKHRWLWTLCAMGFLTASTAIIATSCKNPNKPQEEIIDPTNPKNESSSTTPDDSRNTSTQHDTPNNPANPNTNPNPNNDQLVDAPVPAEIRPIMDQLEVVISQYNNVQTPPANLTINDLKNNLDQIKLTLKGQQLSLFSARVSELRPDYNSAQQDISSKTGHAVLIVQIVHNKTKTYITKEIEIQGFKTSPVLVDENGFIVQEENADQKQKQLDYFTKYTAAERVKYDNDDYMVGLKNQWHNALLRDVRPDLASVQANQKNTFNTLSAALGLDTYDNQAYKGYTLPVYNPDNTVNGLSIANNLPPQGPAWVDAYHRNGFKNKGLARLLLNKQYQTMGEQTFSVSFTNKNPDYKPGNENDPSISTDDKSKFSLSLHRGTMWILDYEQPQDNSYPTKWYFATNLHVADLLNETTQGISLTRLNQNPPLNTKFTLTDYDDHFTSFIISNQEEELKSQRINDICHVVYQATDFLNKDPVDYLADEFKAKYADKKEFADFAVIEIDFSKVQANEWSIWANNKQAFNDLHTNQEITQALTNDYANQKDKQIKFINYDYLNHFTDHDAPLLKADFEKYPGDQFYLLGYPLAIEDFYFSQYDEEKVKQLYRNSTSLWTNCKYEFFDQPSIDEVGVSQETKEKTQKEMQYGGRFSYQVGYRSFLNKPGISDAFLASPYNGQKLMKTHDNHEYISFGLQYLPRDYEPYGGASGSSMRNQRNEVIGLYHTKTQNTSTGLVLALRSQGFDYKGLYGQYNLPQYDLIYGTGKDQKTSYRQALASLYQANPQMRTNLFPNGFAQENIDPKFLFKNS